MGLFDYVTVEVPLPDGYTPASNERFQTKNFDNAMMTLKITANGRLEILLFDEEYVGEYHPEWAEDGFTIPRYERINERWSEWHERDGSKFHGRFTFYGIDDQNKWHEYIAKFTDGQLEEILIVPDRLKSRQDQ